jgi:hypothetical protein
MVGSLSGWGGGGWSQIKQHHTNYLGHLPMNSFFDPFVLLS